MNFGIKKLVSNTRGSPMVEEALLMGLSLFVFLILSYVIFDLLDFVNNVFSEFSDTLTDFPK